MDVNASGGPACADCEPGFFAPASGMSECEPCMEGSSDVGQSYCTPCKAGHHLYNNICEPCVAGSWSDAGSIECSRCSVGRFSTGGAARCEPCASGSFGRDDSATAASTRTSQEDACTGCPAGRFSRFTALVSKDECTGCAPGRRSEAVGAQSVDVCVMCLPGTSQGEVGSSACLPCVAGKYASTHGHIKCDVCPAGYFCKDGSERTKCPPGTQCPLEGLREPVLCLADTYQDSKNSTGECKACPSEQSTFGRRGATVQDDCYICPKGAYCDADLSSERAELGVLSGGAAQTADGTAAPCDVAFPVRAGFYRQPAKADTERRGACTSNFFMPCPGGEAACQGVNEAESVLFATNTTAAQWTLLSENASAIQLEEGCAEGYIGAMCMTCSANYARSSEYGCAACSDDAVVASLAGLVIVLGAGIAAVLIRRTIQAKGQQGSIEVGILKLLISHLTVIGSVALYPLEWPSALYGWFDFADSIATAGGDVIAPDCLVNGFSGADRLGSPVYVRTLVTAMVPVIGVALFALAWFAVARHAFKVKASARHVGALPLF